MSIDTLIVVLLVWTITGLLAAIAFGKAIRGNETSDYEEEPLPTSADMIKYFGKNKSSAVAREVNAAKTAKTRSGTMKRAAS